MSDPEKKIEQIFNEPGSKKETEKKSPARQKGHLPKWLKITLLIVAVLVIAGFTYWLYKVNWDIDPGETKDGGLKVSCPLTDLKTTSLLAQKRPISIMIENSTNARPQSGIANAEMVFEAVAEGGITRFLAVYQCQEAIKEIGPVRSARIYYVDWAKGLDALYSHIGGSPDGLEEIESLNVADLNQFALGNYYWRSTDRLAPHNVYTTLEKLYEAAKSKKLDTNGKIDSLKYKKEAKSAELTITSATLKVNFSSVNYNIIWTYNKTKNNWLRSQGGANHTDALNQKQVSAKNIAIAYTTITTRSDGRKDVITTGTGDGVVYVDGKEIKATWKKKTASDMLRFYNATTKKEIEFNPGNLWIEFVTGAGSVIYSGK
jgi:hypothetical protein